MGNHFQRESSLVAAGVFKRSLAPASLDFSVVVQRRRVTAADAASEPRRSERDMYTDSETVVR